MDTKTVKYIFSKILLYLTVFILALTVNFFLTRLIPGSAISTLLSALSGSSGALAASSVSGGSSFLVSNIHYLEAEFGLVPQPLYIQYYHYILGVFTGNLGISISYYPLTVANIIGSSLGITLSETFIAVIVAFFVGSWLGSIFAIRRAKISEISATNILAIFITIPAFVIIMYLELIFAVKLKLVSVTFPGMSLSLIGIAHLVNFFAVPMAGFITSLVPGFYFGMRNTMIHALKDNYTQYSEILGFKKSTIRKFVYRNSMLPNITNFFISLGLGISSALTIEGLLGIPGSGYYFGNAIFSRDLPLLQGIFLIIVLMLIVSLAIVEIVYGLIDPRVRST
ncbi:MAG: ABC transporter permease [Caldisphaeraceae archaeon]|nr:ABC transporter permease [Caldisphaeraceae archaeon]